MEAAAALDTMRVMKLVGEAVYARGIDLLEGIVAISTSRRNARIATSRQQERQKRSSRELLATKSGLSEPNARANAT